MRKPSLLSSIALVAAVACAAWCWNELRAERARSAALVAQLESARAAAILAPRSPPSPAASPVAVSNTTTAPGAAPATISPAKEVQGTQPDWESYQARLMRDPKYREARREQERLALAPRRANLIRLLGLSPAQADAAIELQLDRDAQWNDAYRMEVVTDEDRFERRARLEAVDQAYQDRVRTLLGEDQRARLESYMESRASRMQVDRLRSELTEANALRDDQVEPLIAALHTEHAQMQNDLQEFSDTLSWEGDQRETWKRYTERQAELMKSMNERMHSSASALLTNAQLDALDDLLRREYARFEAQQRVNRIQSKLDQAKPPTSN
jgi:hypothetical protein